MSSSPALPHDDYYAILNLPRTASLDDIRHAYRILGPAVHPDKLHHTLTLASVSLPPSFPLASTFHRVQRAAAVLSDPLTRWAWDEYGEDGVKAAEKLRARLAWRTEQSAREYIRNAVTADRQRSGQMSTWSRRTAMPHPLTQHAHWASGCQVAYDHSQLHTTQLHCSPSLTILLACRLTPSCIAVTCHDHRRRPSPQA